MCRHSELVFLGYQETISNNKLALYNCLECGTTITLKKKKKTRISTPPKRITLKVD